MFSDSLSDPANLKRLSAVLQWCAIALVFSGGLLQVLRYMVDQRERELLQGVVSQKELDQAHEGERERNLADLVDRLSARLGGRRVTKAQLVDTHIPEFAVAAIPASRARTELVWLRPRQSDVV